MSNRRSRWILQGMAAVFAAYASVGAPAAQQPRSAPPAAAQNAVQSSASSAAPYRALVSTHCLSCHNSKMKAGKLELDAINTQDLAAQQEVWEKVVLKLRARQMPPLGARQPDQAAHDAALTSLEAALDGLSAASPNPGRTDTFRRLNRTEYRNAIRDLLALDIDPAALVPSDSASYGFDNLTGGTLSPTWLES
jgi:mono/diheme cytochrome c family protein